MTALAFLFVAVVAAVVGAAGALLWVVPIAELSGKGMGPVPEPDTLKEESAGP